MSRYVNLIVSVAVEENGKFLMVKEAKKDIKDLWNFPSGKVKMGETLIEAAEREALEETGYRVKITDICSIYHYSWDDGEGISIRFNFWGKKIDNGQTSLAKDVKEVKAMDREQLELLIREKKYRFAGVPLMIKDVLSGKMSGINSLLTTNESIEKVWDDFNKKIQ